MNGEGISAPPPPITANIGAFGGRIRPSVWGEQVILYIACGILAFAVLALGAVQEWGICGLECGAALLFALWAAQQMALERIRLTNSAMIPALVLLSLPVLQLATGHTAYFYATRYSLLQWLAYGAFFLVGSEFSGSSSARTRLAIGIAAFGTLYATFAMIQGLTASRYLLYGIVKTPGTGFGSYINRNHYAGLMEMVIPFGLVISTSRSVPSSVRLLSSFGSLVMLASIFVSGSRGGMVAVVIALIYFVIHYWRHERTSTTLRTVLAAAILASVFVGFFSYERVASRSVMEATDSIRLQIARDSIHLVAQHPFWGSGLGTFTDVYPQVRTFPTNLFVNAAHDDYVQLVAETGLIGLLCTAAFLFLVFRNALLHVHHARQSWFSAVTLAAMIGCIALLVHSLFDFNLEIPANAATFAFLAGLASATPDRPSDYGPERYSKASFRGEV